jgi:hypothetical protein
MGILASISHSVDNKTVTLRVGGSKLYENAGVPIAAGFVAGCVIAILFGSALGAVSFSHPF